MPVTKTVNLALQTCLQYLHELSLLRDGILTPDPWINNRFHFVTGLSVISDLQMAEHISNRFIYCYWGFPP